MVNSHQPVGNYKPTVKIIVLWIWACHTWEVKVDIIFY